MEGAQDKKGKNCFHLNGCLQCIVALKLILLYTFNTDVQGLKVNSSLTLRGKGVGELC